MLGHSTQRSIRSREGAAQPVSVMSHRECELGPAAGDVGSSGSNSGSSAIGPAATNIHVPCEDDDAADVRISIMESSTTSELEGCLPEEENDSRTDLRYEVPIPYETYGECTFAYRRTLQTRIRDVKLHKHNEYDMGKYKPTFIHDLLMQPGSLANLIGDTSPEQLIHRMTPAILTGFNTYVHSDTNLPCILQSPNSTDHVQGMLLLGQGKKGRIKIHQHYGANTRRVTLAVEIEVVVPISSYRRIRPADRWDLKRRTISAHVWLWANVGSGDVRFRAQFPRWTLEDYISGTFRAAHLLDVRDASEWPDAEVTVLEYDDDDEEQHPWR